MRTRVSLFLIAGVSLVSLFFLISCDDDEKKVPAISVNVSPEVTITGATIDFTISGVDGPVQEVGFIYCPTPQVALDCDTKTSFGTADGSGEYQEEISGLEPNTTFYLTAYMLVNGTVIYSNEISFNTSDPNVVKPVVANISAVSYTTATISIIIDHVDGAVDDIGVSFSASDPSNPNTDISFGAVNGNGIYTHDLTGLQPNTTYYLEAYIKYQSVVIWSNQITFSTPPPNYVDESKPMEIFNFPERKVLRGDHFAFTGKYFGTDISAYKLMIGGAEAIIESISITWPSDSIFEIQAVVPENAPYGPQDVLLTLENDIPNNQLLFEDQLFVKFNLVREDLNPLPGEFQGNSFSIDNTGYLITDQEVWSYEPASDTWTRKNDFPGGKRTEATGFSINGKGYLCFGMSPGGTYPENRLREVWEYAPAADQWTRLGDFPGEGRFSATAQVVGDGAYIGFGVSLAFDKGFGDLWYFDPSIDTWTAMPGSFLEDGNQITFLLGDEIFIGFGSGACRGGGLRTRVLKFNVVNHSTEQAPFLPERIECAPGAVGFIRDGKGIFAGSELIFVYDPETNSWWPGIPAGIWGSSFLFVIDGWIYQGNTQTFSRSSLPADF